MSGIVYMGNGLLYNVKKLFDDRMHFLFSTAIFIVTYGYSLTHVILGNDSFVLNEYSSATNNSRFGMIVWNFLFGLHDCISYPEKMKGIDIFGGLLLFLSSYLILAVFQMMTEIQLTTCEKMAFSGVFLSYPLVTEIWMYYGMPFFLGIGYAEISLVIWLLNRERNRERNYVIATIVLTFCVSTYESFAIVYIVFVLIIAYSRCLIKADARLKIHNIIFNNIHYLFVLFVAIAFKAIIGKLIARIANVQYGSTGAANSIYLKYDFFAMIKDTLLMYVIRGFIYFPIGIFVFSITIFIILTLHFYFQTRSTGLLFLGISAALCNFLITFLQGKAQPYRTCQSFNLFIGFVFLLTIRFMSNIRKKEVFLGVLIIISIWQSLYSSEIYVSNVTRTEEETFALRTIAADLKAREITKPIRFTGKYTCSKDAIQCLTAKEGTINYRIYSKLAYFLKYDKPNDGMFVGETNFNSIINWSIYAYNQESMRQLMEYLNYSYSVGPAVQENSSIIGNMPGWPDDGYIFDAGEYVIVNFR
jgi:hypothetical protein